MFLDLLEKEWVQKVETQKIEALWIVYDKNPFDRKVMMWVDWKLQGTLFRAMKFANKKDCLLIPQTHSNMGTLALSRYENLLNSKDFSFWDNLSMGRVDVLSCLVPEKMENLTSYLADNFKNQTFRLIT